MHVVIRYKKKIVKWPSYHCENLPYLLLSKVKLRNSLLNLICIRYFHIGNVINILISFCSKNYCLYGLKSKNKTVYDRRSLRPHSLPQQTFAKQEISLAWNRHFYSRKTLSQVTNSCFPCQVQTMSYCPLSVSWKGVSVSWKGGWSPWCEYQWL